MANSNSQRRSASLVEHAPAKINLTLAVLGRDDVCTCGYCGGTFRLDMPRPGEPF